TFLYFLGMLGVNFAIVNLIIPLPVVDGGLLILLGLEKLRGKILSLKTQTVINHISYAILITLAVLITIQDVGNLSSLFGWFGK
ncbi:MAG: site-2 protease family protein, partial [Candidatus Hydrogenedentes bacterium]|nr:site-2 protease family protein [Candidatus Hydrogenedentota bacterium]